MCRHYNKPRQVKIFYEEGVHPIEHSVIRPLLINLVESEVLHTDYVGILQSGELIQRNGDLIGYLWGRRFHRV